VIVQGLESFAVVLAGAGFAVQHVQLEDFDFGGLESQVQFRLPQAIQATFGEYQVQIIPNRFQIVVTGFQPTASRIDTLKRVTLRFIEEYSTRRGVSAIGHNFNGNIETQVGSAIDFMKHVAWPSDLSEALGGSSPGGSGEESIGDPTLSLVTTFNLTEEASRTIRLEPLVRDNSRLFYDINFNWGQLDKPLQIPVIDALEKFADSAKHASELIDRVASLGSSMEGGRS
jgi:hypothetical protein